MPSSLSTCYEQMVNRCTQVHTTHRYTQHRFTWYLQFWYREVPAIQVQLETPTVTHGPPHCRHQLPKHSICPARRHHYGTNMVTIIILPLSPSIYYLTRQICVGATYSERSPKSASYISHPRPSNSYSCRSSSTLVRGFRVGPTPVIRKIVGREEKEGGYKKWPISWLALN